MTYIVPPVWLAPELLRPPATPYQVLVADLTRIHHRVHVTEFLGDGYDACGQCRIVFPCLTMMLVSHACRVEWSRHWSPPKPVPSAAEVATWPVR